MVSATLFRFVCALFFIRVHELFPDGDRRAATWLFPAMGSGAHKFRLSW
jgi:hypothetical protein